MNTNLEYFTNVSMSFACHRATMPKWFDSTQWALRADVLCMLTCQNAFRTKMLAFQRGLTEHQCALHANVLCIPTRQLFLRSSVPTCFAC